VILFSLQVVAEFSLSKNFDINMGASLILNSKIENRSSIYQKQKAASISYEAAFYLYKMRMITVAI